MGPFNRRGGGQLSPSTDSPAVDYENTLQILFFQLNREIKMLQNIKYFF